MGCLSCTVSYINYIWCYFLPDIITYCVYVFPCVISDGPLNHACCVKYTKKPLPFGLIKGYIEQSSREVCRIDAIMWVTNWPQEWVRVHPSSHTKWLQQCLNMRRIIVMKPTALLQSTFVQMAFAFNVKQKQENNALTQSLFLSFFTKHNKKVCASVKDEWVRATLARLR